MSVSSSFLPVRSLKTHEFLFDLIGRLCLVEEPLLSKDLVHSPPPVCPNPERYYEEGSRVEYN